MYTQRLVGEFGFDEFPEALKELADDGVFNGNGIARVVFGFLGVCFDIFGFGWDNRRFFSFSGRRRGIVGFFGGGRGWLVR